MFHSSSIPTTTEASGGSGASLSSLHSDVIRTHILNRLDGTSLISLSCASSPLYSLSNEEILWTNICLSTWPSINHSRMRQVISKYPNGPRSFFSNSFPLLLTHPCPCPAPSQDPREIISAVDIHYKGKLIFSKVEETVTRSRWFLCSSFRIELVDLKTVVPTAMELDQENVCQSLMEDLTLTWIMVIGNKAANLSSVKPVSAQMYRLTNDVRVRFASILAVDEEVDVMCEIIVTFEREMEVGEVSMHVEDMDGFDLNGQASYDILQRAVESGERSNSKNNEKGKERHEDYLQRCMKRTRRAASNDPESGWASDSTFMFFHITFEWQAFAKNKIKYFFKHGSLDASM